MHLDEVAKQMKLAFETLPKSERTTCCMDGTNRNRPAGQIRKPD